MAKKEKNPMSEEEKFAKELEAEAELDEQADLAQEQNEAGKYREMAQRIQADFENYKKRNASSRLDGRNDGISDTVTTLLPVLDSMEAAAKMYRKDESKKELEEGFNQVIKQFLDALSSLGVTQIESQDKEFDPNVHEAILQQPVDGKEPGMVIEVYRNGYKLGDHVIRPAQVVVSA